eukprot:10273048-Karenia_brevis.AAC.1
MMFNAIWGYGKPLDRRKVGTNHGALPVPASDDKHGSPGQKESDVLVDMPGLRKQVGSISNRPNQRLGEGLNRFLDSASSSGTSRGPSSADS